jgi:hypothetical protein
LLRVCANLLLASLLIAGLLALAASQEPKLRGPRHSHDQDRQCSANRCGEKRNRDGDLALRPEEFDTDSSGVLDDEVNESDSDHHGNRHSHPGASDSRIAALANCCAVRVFGVS